MNVGPRSAFWSLFFNPFVHDSANPTRKLVEKSTKPFPNTWLTSIHLKCPTSAVTFWLYITCAVSLPARTSHVFKTSCITTTRPPLHNIIPLSSLMPVLVETVSVEMVLVTSSLLHSEVTSDTGCIWVPWSKHLLVYWALVITGKNIKQKKLSGVEVLPRSFGHVISIITYCKLHMWGVWKETWLVELHKAFNNPCSYGSLN